MRRLQAAQNEVVHCARVLCCVLGEDEVLTPIKNLVFQQQMRKLRRAVDECDTCLHEALSGYHNIEEDRE